eukprot:442952_1
MTQHQSQQINTRILNKNHQRDAGLIAPIKGTEKFATQRSKILRSKSGQQIKAILNSSTDFDITVYGAAIQKSGNLKDIESCNNIMQLLANRNIMPDVNIFNILFQAFKLNQRMDYVGKYLEQMINIYDIQPDLITANTLLAIFTKHGDVTIAHKIWSEIMPKYNLAPNERTYAALIQIYGKNGNIQQAMQFYEEMKSKLNIQPTLFTQTIMIRAFTQNNQIKNALNIKYEMEQNGQALDAQCYVCFVGFYLKDTLHFNPYETLKLIQEYESKCKEANDIIMNLKFAANLKLLENANETQQKNQLFDTLTRTLPGERISIGLPHWNDSCAKIVLLSHLVYYNDNERHVIGQCFDRLCQIGAIGYWFYCKHVGRWMIDLHGFGYKEVKFILYYLLSCKYDYLIEVMGYEWIIICGKGLSTDPLSKQSQIGIKNYIMNELKGFNIDSKTKEFNSGRIMLNVNDVIAYVQRKKNTKKQGL